MAAPTSPLLGDLASLVARLKRPRPEGPPFAAERVPEEPGAVSPLGGLAFGQPPPTVGAVSPSAERFTGDVDLPPSGKFPYDPTKSIRDEFLRAYPPPVPEAPSSDYYGNVLLRYGMEALPKELAEAPEIDEIWRRTHALRGELASFLPNQEVSPIDPHGRFTVEGWQPGPLHAATLAGMTDLEELIADAEQYAENEARPKTPEELLRKRRELLKAYPIDWAPPKPPGPSGPPGI